MNIGTASKESGVPAKSIRYYESIGLLRPAERGDNGYRNYSENDILILRFIHRSRRLGFPVPDVARLLELWSDRNRASADVKAVAMEQIAEVERRINELESIRKTLKELVHQCHGDDRPDCPIIDNLASHDRGCSRPRK